MMETGTADTILYSGSFNPIHRGHLAVAEQVLQAFPGSELWLVVSPQNPLKSETDLAPEHNNDFHGKKHSPADRRGLL